MSIPAFKTSMTDMTLRGFSQETDHLYRTKSLSERLRIQNGFQPVNLPPKHGPATHYQAKGLNTQSPISAILTEWTTVLVSALLYE